MRVKFSILVLSVLLILAAGSLNAQLYQQWSQKWGPVEPAINDSTNLVYTGNVAVDEEGNSYIYAEDNFVNTLTKFNTQGQVVWRRTDLSITTFPGYIGYANLRYYKGNLYYSNFSGITKINLDGTAIWNWNTYNFQGGYGDMAQWIMDNAGNIVAAWQTQMWPQEVDSQQLLAKIDTNGNTLWTYNILLENSDSSFQNYYVICDSLNNIYFSYAEHIWEQPIPWTDAQWLMKFSPSGQVIWSYGQGVDADQVGFTPLPHNDGTCLALFPAGSFTKLYNFDPTGNLDTTYLVSGSYNFLFQKGGFGYYTQGSLLVKADMDLNIISQVTIPGSYIGYILNDNKYIYITTTNLTDTQNEVSIFDYDSHLIQTLLPYFRNGSDVWPSLGSDGFGNLYFLNSDWSDSAELYKFCARCLPNVTGTLYHDSNQNCQKDSNELGLASRLIQATPGPYYAVSDSNGNFGLLLPLGNYNLTQLLPTYWNATCSDSLPIILDPTHVVLTGNLFGSYETQHGADMAVFIQAGEAVPGYYQHIDVTLSNFGLVTDSGVVAVTLDTMFFYAQASPQPDSASNNIFFFKYNNLQPNRSVDITILDEVPNYLAPGYAYQISAFVTPIINDVNPANNYDTITGIVLGSMDPNEKTCSVKNTTPSGNLTDSSIIIYSILFQNTGTDTARKIVVVDTLDPNLDISTFTVLQTSIKNYQLSFVGQGILQFTFSNAQLPDSSVNLAMSQAFIKYSIAPKQNLAPGTTIFNAATIYFDFNPGVTTNTTVNYFERAPTGITSITAFNQSVTVYPNPMGNMAKIVLSVPTGLATIASVYDVSGRLITTQNFACDRNMLIERNSMQQGLYLLELKQQNQKIGVAKIVIE